MGRYEHGDIWGSLGATIRVRIYVAIIGDTGWGEGGWEDGPRGDWRDCCVRAWVITGRWKVTESAEGGKGIVEGSTVVVGHRELGCKPNWHEGCHESLHLFNDRKFIEDKENGVHIRCSDSHILNKLGNSLNTRKRWGRCLVKPTPKCGRFRELGCTR